jgi:GNAT superfamily N-acetyltransferase
MTGLSIRELLVRDLDALLSLYGHLHERDDPPPPRGDLERIWSAIVADPAHLYVGGFVDGKLVSACNAAVIPNLTRGARPYAVVENVVTDAQFRRRGIGAKVLGHLIERCWERRCYKVMLMSASRRDAAHAFYESLGFDRTAKQAFVLSAR